MTDTLETAEVSTPQDKVETLAVNDHAELERLRQFEKVTLQKNLEAEKKYDEALKLREQAHKQEMDTLKSSLEKQLQESQQLNEKLLIDGGLSKALDNVDVDSRIKGGATALLRPLIQIKGGKAMVGDKELDEYIKEWAVGDEGKNYTNAPQSSGMGASQTSASGSFKKMQDMTEKERIDLYQQDPQAFKALANQ